MSQYHPPQYELNAFDCPRCGAFAHQVWAKVSQVRRNQYEQIDELRTSKCMRCTGEALWLRERLIDPRARTAPLPNADLTDEIKRDYNEAAEIEHLSPKGAAALLRLCVQRLCADVGGDGKNINEDVKLLVKNGLPVEIQQALDVVRVVGNNAVHPGVIDIDDKPEAVSALFVLINAIADRLITQPKKVAELYGSLPPGIVAAIEKRDKPQVP